MPKSNQAIFWKALIWPAVSGLLAAALLIVTIRSTLLQPQESAFLTPKFDNEVTAPVHSYSNAVQKSAPAVVNIYTRSVVAKQSHPLFQDPLARKLFGLKAIPKKRVLTGLGSGVIMNSQGYVLTNYHVIRGADEILVELSDKRETRASIVGVDPETDLAVLKIQLQNLPYIEATSNNVRVGDIALAIGNPLGIGQTVTMGIISATGRNNLGLSTYENFIQTDAAINRGNSGGALIDTQGRLVGINSVIFSKSGGSDGIGFAIPAALAKQVLESIIRHGKVVRGWLGANFQKLSPELANYIDAQKTYGVVIVQLLEGGPAEKAGIMPGDLITEINGEAIIDEQDALGAIARIQPGQYARLSIHRKAKDLSLKVQLGERPVQQ